MPSSTGGGTWCWPTGIRTTSRSNTTKLKDLALARDVDAAVALLTEHIERAPRELIAYATEHGVEGFQD